jgi:hypothetical protein
LAGAGYVTSTWSRRELVSRTIASAATPIAASTPTATTSTPASRFLRTCFIHDEISATKVLTIQRIDGAVGFFITGDFNKGKTTRLSGETVADEIDCRRINTCLSKKLVQSIFGCGERKITDVKLLH